MTEALCAPFASCDGLDGRLLISAAIQGPPLAWDLGEVSFGAFTSNASPRVLRRHPPRADVDAEGGVLRTDPIDFASRRVTVETFRPCGNRSTSRACPPASDDSADEGGTSR
jgi:hypothetical protein